ncbi:hypothetical protein EVAR_63380_1 [Eumeta japonica]|uniref:Uncharacterized protein n=1 Tax=Eumeta variegata TaxID=151549 RepID=A0A4C1YUT7_EUMVA|nr:hypothetical protein EVAR_63380_1 [Eumeta japonica]
MCGLSGLIEEAHTREPVGMSFVQPLNLKQIRGKNFHQGSHCNSSSREPPLVNNIGELTKFALEYKADIIMVQKTFLKPRNLTVVDDSSQVVLGNYDHKELPGDVSKLIRTNNAAFRRANKYPICENRCHVHALQLKVRARMREV